MKNMNIWSDFLGEQSAEDTYAEILQCPGEEFTDKINHILSGLYSEYDYDMLLESNPTIIKDIANSLLYELNR